MTYREQTKVIQIGNVKIGGGNPIAIQSMTNTPTENVEATVEQILRLEKAGCEIVRCTVPTKEAAEAIKEIKKQIHIPLVADIHFDYKMAILAMENGADKIRINPGNIGSKERVEAVVQVAKERNIPIRVGVNSGSLEKDLVKKYGGVVVGLTLDENGIPETAEGRVEIAGRILSEAEKYGIDKKDIVIDVLTMTISSEPDSAKVTLEALRQVKEQYGVKTVLGVSNISFGLPNRPVINANFYTMAMQNGLTAGIINPSSEDMMRSYYSYLALMGFDKNCENYIERCKKPDSVTEKVVSGAQMDLKTVIIKGLKEEAFASTKELVKSMKPLDIIHEHLIPALDVVGKGFEQGTVFLPQLLMSADSAKNAFAVLKEYMALEGQVQEKKEKIVLATVKGDIHDIGKNIVKVLLENYGYDVIDLGKDVAPEVIVDTVVREDVKLVGLSALMTTTVVSMEETIKQLREKTSDCKVMVGGAVLNQEYADMIGADFYGKDAMQSVYYAQNCFADKN